MEIEERFWSKVAWSQDETACWLWTAGTDNDGYGTFWLAGSTVLAHRLAYEMEVGDPAGMEIDHRHTCPKRCCNPSHLRLATHKQNKENHSGPHRNNTSGVRGVTWDKRSSRWCAGVKHNGRRIHVGYFTDKDEAEAAVVAARNSLHTHNDIDK